MTAFARTYKQALPKTLSYAAYFRDDRMRFGLRSA